jgi:hypothetical protein
VWTAASYLPIIGRSLKTPRGLADALNTLSQDALPQTVNAANQLNIVRGKSLSQGLPVATLKGAAPHLDVAALQMDAAVLHVESLPHSLLLPGLSAPYRAALDQLRELTKSVHTAADATAIAPGILGADGPRRYFIAFVNPAEARAGAGAGLFGAYAIVTANNGKLHTETVGTDADLPDLKTPPPGVPADFVNRYRDIGGDTSWTSSNLSPHFPYDAAVWAAMYKQVTGVQVDGVAALDPVALSVLLKGQAPLQLRGLGTITSANVVRFIEHDEYSLPLTPSQRKDVLKQIAKAAAQRIEDGRNPVSRLLPDLARSADDGHVSAYSVRPEEQTRIARYPVAGVLPDTNQPFAAAYVTNSSSGKLEYYLRSSLTYADTRCDSGQRTSIVTVTLTNRAPASGLPAYVTVRGDNPTYLTVPGQVRETLDVFLTNDASVVAATLDGSDVLSSPVNENDHSQLSTDMRERQHPVAELSLELHPGQTRQLRLMVVTKPSNTGSPIVVAPPIAGGSRAMVTGQCA